MECREFREIADSYLDDELLVETNHRVRQHLERCPECRKDLAARRALRSRLSSAVISARESIIDPVFGERLADGLRHQTLESGIWRRMLSVKVLVPVVAGLIIVAVIGITFFRGDSVTPTIPVTSRTDLFKEHFLAAAETHRDCGLKKVDYFVSISKTETPLKATYREKIVKPLETRLFERWEILDAHDCLYHGNLATHVILRREGQIVSVIFDRSKDKHFQTSIISEKEAGFQIAAFQSVDQTVFVISDLPEGQNLSLARTLADAWENDV